MSMKILIVRVSSLGDVLHNMPMVADIRRRYPDAQIDWVVEEAFIGLVRLNDGVRNIIPFALRRWRKNLLSLSTWREIGAFRAALKREAYDVVFDTQGLTKTGVVMGMARLAPGGKKVGLGNATEGSGYESISRIFHTMSVNVDKRTHAVLRGRLVAAAALGYAVDTPADFNLQAPVMKDAGGASPAPAAWLPAQPYAVFFHGTARRSKQWAPENWIRIGKHLAQRGLPVLLPWGSEQERQDAQLLADKLDNARVLPKLPLEEAMLLAQRAAIVIGVDTGLTHIAAAYRRPTIELYCDSPRWKTEGNWSPRIINLGDEGMPPSPQDVEGSIAQLLDKDARDLRPVSADR